MNSDGMTRQQRILPRIDTRRLVWWGCLAVALVLFAPHTERVGVRADNVVSRVPDDAIVRQPEYPAPIGDVAIPSIPHRNANCVSATCSELLAETAAPRDDTEHRHEVGASPVQSERGNSTGPTTADQSPASGVSEEANRITVLDTNESVEPCASQSGAKTPAETLSETVDPSVASELANTGTESNDSTSSERLEAPPAEAAKKPSAGAVSAVEVTLDLGDVGVPTNLNYASAHLGARIADHSSEADGVHHILIENSDKYLSVPCAAPRKRFTVQLSREIVVTLITIQSEERFSGTIQHFTIAGSRTSPCRPPECHWEVLASNLEAARTRERQSFRIPSRPPVRFLRVYWINQYGTEKRCTLSSLSVFGVDMLETLSSELSTSLADLNQAAAPSDMGEAEVPVDGGGGEPELADASDKAPTAAAILPVDAGPIGVSAPGASDGAPAEDAASVLMAFYETHHGSDTEKDDEATVAAAALLGELARQGGIGGSSSLGAATATSATTGEPATGSVQPLNGTNTDFDASASSASPTVSLATDAPTAAAASSTGASSASTLSKTTAGTTTSGANSSASNTGGSGGGSDGRPAAWWKARGLQALWRARPASVRNATWCSGAGIHRHTTGIDVSETPSQANGSVVEGSDLNNTAVSGNSTQNRSNKTSGAATAGVPDTPFRPRLCSSSRRTAAGTGRCVDGDQAVELWAEAWRIAAESAASACGLEPPPPPGPPVPPPTWSPQQHQQQRPNGSGVAAGPAAAGSYVPPASVGAGVAAAAASGGAGASALLATLYFPHARHLRALHTNVTRLQVLAAETSLRVSEVASAVERSTATAATEIARVQKTLTAQIELLRRRLAAHEHAMAQALHNAEQLHRAAEERWDDNGNFLFGGGRSGLLPGIAAAIADGDRSGIALAVTLWVLFVLLPIVLLSPLRGVARATGNSAAGGAALSNGGGRGGASTSPRDDSSAGGFPQLSSPTAMEGASASPESPVDRRQTTPFPPAPVPSRGRSVALEERSQPQPTLQNSKGRSDATSPMPNASPPRLESPETPSLSEGTDESPQASRGLLARRATKNTANGRQAKMIAAPPPATKGKAATNAAMACNAVSAATPPPPPQELAQFPQTNGIAVGNDVCPGLLVKSCSGELNETATFIPSPTSAAEAEAIAALWRKGSVRFAVAPAWRSSLVKSDDGEDGEDGEDGDDDRGD